MTTDSPDYLKKKAFYKNLLTIYGRKPVLEALQDDTLQIHRLHLASSNKTPGIIEEILHLASQRNVETLYHDRKSLSRISKNSKQDQGVAADIHIDSYYALEDFIASKRSTECRLLALDNITNPQNLGMIIRSACAGHIDGIVIPEKGCASLSPLVIKASAGTLFKATLLRCSTLTKALDELSNAGFEICSLSSHARQSLFEHNPRSKTVYILGNESEGIGSDIVDKTDTQLRIPMNNDVESLNVAITAALIAFHH